jgi:hypothetical protein
MVNFGIVTSPERQTNIISAVSYTLRHNKDVQETVFSVGSALRLLAVSN